MKATVREYTVKKKVVVLEIDEAEAHLFVTNQSEGGWSVGECMEKIVTALDNALEADRASDAKEDEDVPF